MCMQTKYIEQSATKYRRQSPPYFSHKLAVLGPLCPQRVHHLPVVLAELVHCLLPVPQKPLVELLGPLEQPRCQHCLLLGQPPHPLEEGSSVLDHVPHLLE